MQAKDFKGIAQNPVQESVIDEIVATGNFHYLDDQYDYANYLAAFKRFIARFEELTLKEWGPGIKPYLEDAERDWVEAHKDGLKAFEKQNPL